MINEITHSQKNIKLLLNNPINRKIYKVDSINLIIGINGSGKTTLIKEIINHFKGEDQIDKIISSSEYQKLGITYYTSTPFHKKIKSYAKNHVSFIDCSLSNHNNKDNIDNVLEKINIKRNLGIKNSSIFEKVFNKNKILDEIIKSKIENDLKSKKYDQRIIPGYYNKIYDFDIESENASKHLNEIIKNSSSEDITKNNEYIDLYHLKKSIISKRNLRIKRIAETIKKEIGKVDSTMLIAYEITNDSVIKQEIATIINENKEKYRYTKNLLRIVSIINNFNTILRNSSESNFYEDHDSIKILCDIEYEVTQENTYQTIKEAQKIGIINGLLNNYSSGEAAILHQLLTISKNIERHALKGYIEQLVIIDEADMLLHLEWQRKYVTLIDDYLANLKKNLNLQSLQLIIATHSPILASDITRYSIASLNIECEDIDDISSFGAPIQKIINKSFNTPSIGKLAEKLVKELSTKKNLSQEDLNVIDLIDDKLIRDFLLRDKND